MHGALVRVLVGCDYVTIVRDWLPEVCMYVQLLRAAEHLYDFVSNVGGMFPAL